MPATQVDTVVMNCIKTSSDQHQLVLIENICKEDTAMVRLAYDQYGHMAVLTVLEVFRHMQIHNTFEDSWLDHSRLLELGLAGR